MTEYPHHKPMTVGHYLITIDVSPHERMHCYLMTDDKRYVENAINKMIYQAERMGLKPFFPVVLVTDLSTTGIDLVRKKVGNHSQEAKRNFETATDFHSSVWIGTTADPDDGWLMALH